MVPELQKKKYDHSSICLLIALVSEVFRILCDSFSISSFAVEDFFRDVEGNMFEDIMHNHVGLPHLLPAPEKNSSNNDLVENDDDQIVSESSHSTGFHKFHFANIKKYSKNRNTMSFQNFEKFRLKKQPLVRPTTKKPLQRPTKPNMLRPAVHKSQHHSSIASRQQSLVSSVSDSERYVHSTVDTI